MNTSNATLQQPLSLYLHIPFCRTLCSYCAFNVFTGRDDSFDAFVDALATEIRLAGRANPGMPVHTVFFGGGTPSLLSPDHYRQLFDALHQSFTIQDNAEICLESNPNDLDAPYLAALRDIGFNRISIGMQSANAAQLTLYQREHTMKMVEDAVRYARETGWQNISLDLIYGAPDETLADWSQTVEQALALQPDHISMYGLTLEGNTPLKDAVDAGTLPEPDDDLLADMYEQGSQMLASAGLQQYEISNWALPGYESQHNLQYWRNRPYLGLGPGAHGYANDVRYIVMRWPEKYIQTLQADCESLPFPRTPVVSKAVPVDRETEISDTLMMGLRLTKEGIQRNVFQARFGVDVLDLHAATIKKFEEYGMMYHDDEVVRLTESGRLVSNAIISEFI